MNMSIQINHFLAILILILKLLILIVHKTAIKYEVILICCSIQL